MATIPKLYNLDETRTYVYQQTFTLQTDDNCQKYLDHIPKEGTLYIEDTVTGVVFDIVDNKNPQVGEVFYDYRSAYDYVSAKGLLIFNADDAASGDEISVRYVPVASRVDAEVINKLIDHTNTYDGKIWTKEDLLTPTEEDIIAWEAIKDRPSDATETTHGLITPAEKQVLNAIPKPFVPPATTFTIKNLEFKPSTWGDALQIDLESGINITKESDTHAKISLDGPSIASIIGITQAELAALPGAIGEGKSTTGPGENNKYILDSDVRLSDYRQPLAHNHAIEDVLNLQSQLDNKSVIGHTHAASEITGIEYLKGEDGISPEVTVYSTTTTAAGTEAKVTNVGTVYDVKLKFEIPKGVDGKMVLDWEGWESLTEEQKSQIRIVGPKGDTGVGAAVSIDKIETGQEGSEVQYVIKDPEEKYWPSVERTLMTTGLELTIPKGSTGDQGIGGAVEIGTITASASGSDPQVVIHEPTLKEIGGVMYNTSKVDFTLPRGPQGTGTVSEVSFSSASTDWSVIDEDENYTLTITTTGAVPVSLAYEEINSGLYDVALATVRYEYNKIYIIADHKFTGKIYVDGSMGA